jgi:hypothetical protein
MLLVLLLLLLLLLLLAVVVQGRSRQPAAGPDSCVMGQADQPVPAEAVGQRLCWRSASLAGKHQRAGLPVSTGGSLQLLLLILLMSCAQHLTPDQAS